MTQYNDSEMRKLTVAMQIYNQRIDSIPAQLDHVIYQRTHFNRKPPELSFYDSVFPGKEKVPSFLPPLDYGRYEESYHHWDRRGRSGVELPRLDKMIYNNLRGFYPRPKH
jgi:hypothetical protein